MVVTVTLQKGFQPYSKFRSTHSGTHIYWGWTSLAWRSSTRGLLDQSWIGGQATQQKWPKLDWSTGHSAEVANGSLEHRPLSRSGQSWSTGGGSYSWSNWPLSTGGQVWSFWLWFGFNSIWASQYWQNLTLPFNCMTQGYLQILANPNIATVLTVFTLINSGHSVIKNCTELIGSLF